MKTVNRPTIKQDKLRLSKNIRSYFQNELLIWFKQYGRHDLPWQYPKTPYRVWVSEIMLQQTQVVTVLPYFNRFIAQFSTIVDLAKASEDEVLHLWTGLGYYARARNLHRAARIIVNEFKGVFPATLIELVQLPGIGPSTAGAILSIAFNQKATILDGNVKRVLARWLAIKIWPGEKEITQMLWKIAEELTPTSCNSEYTQAIMDLGATICRPRQPLCHQCPISKHCKAYQEGIVDIIPFPKPKKSLPIKESTFLIFKNNESVFLEKRPAKGLWGGLWSLPELQGKASKRNIIKFCKNLFGQEIKQIETKSSFRHTFTHFHLEIFPKVIELHKRALPQCLPHQIWYSREERVAIGLPSPIKAILENL